MTLRIVDKKSSTIAAERSGDKEIDDLLNGSVGAMVGDFELAHRLVMGVRAVVKAAVGERAAELFVKEQEEQGYRHRQLGSCRLTESAMG